MSRLPPVPRLWRPALAALAVLGAGVGIAQIEQGDRGVAPIDSSSSYEVTGVEVDVSGKDADAARSGGWREAQRRGWRMLYARAHGVPVASVPLLPDSTLDSIVAGIVVENEQISARRYIARLGVLFDRARAGQLLGVGGQTRRSAPMLTIPVMWSGGTPQSYETRTQWQQAWARFRTGGSPIDYVRPIGTGVDPLLLNVAQTRRPGRAWWRLLLDQYGAADILVPEVSLKRHWPGGPVTAIFTARHGPDGAIVDRFMLSIDDSSQIPKLLDQGVRRIDEAYAQALRTGALGPDPSLSPEAVEEPVLEETVDPDAELAAATAAAFTLQVDTPDAAALGQAEGAIRAVPGVRSVATTSLAIGGISLVRILFDGDAAGLSIALAARGLRAEETGDNSFRIRRAGAASPPAAAAPAQPAPAPPGQ